MPATLTTRCLTVPLIALLAACPARNLRQPVVVPPAATPAPPLVLVVVLDQVGRNVLAHHLPFLHEDGAIKQAIARGAWYQRVVYPYAGTYTGPGHAAIFTGATPSESGINANRVWDPARKKSISIVDDGVHPYLDGSGEFGGPGRLRVGTVGDSLHAATGGQARVVSLSMKDRGAMIPGGQHPDLALWYDEKTGVFTSSTYYLAALPAWLTAWQAAHPIEPLLGPWLAGDPDRYARELGPDAAPGEGNWKGLGVTFPHRPLDSKSPFDTFLATPASSEWLLALAAEAATRMGLGDDAVPDLLAVSISGTDYAGHVFGPGSWESVDHLVRADLALGKLIAALERRGPVAVVITADHGVVPLPEVTIAGGGQAVRLEWEQVADVADHAIAAALGPGNWVESFSQPLVYFAPAAETPEARPKAVAAALAALRALPGVAAADDVRDAARLRASHDPLEREIGLSVDERAPGDVIVVPARGSLVDEKMPEGAGTSHGSPWEYDTEVPVLVTGPGVPHVVVAEPLAQARVAATIAALLGVPPPDHDQAEPLPGILVHKRR